MNSSARDLYLSSLDPLTELNARRLAERSSIPDDDPMWLMLHELHQVAREVTSGAHAALVNEAFAERLSVAIGASLTSDERIVDALSGAIQSTRDAAQHALRSLEIAIRDFARRRAVAPAASIAFAVALAITSSCAALWTAYHAGLDYGHNIGYQTGFNNGVTYERSHK